jgi:predicted MPP superfamily phosphohydrolase
MDIRHRGTDAQPCRTGAAPLNPTDLPENDAALATLIPRIGRLHLRQRLGMERDHEARRLRGAHEVHGQEMSETIKQAIRIGLRVTGLHARGRRNARRIAVRRHDVLLPHLPAPFDGFTLLQLSDLHIDAAPGYGRVLMEAVEALSYDVCVLTGDYRARTFGPIDAALAELTMLRRNLRDPVYAVLGNHDTIRLVPPMEDIGYRFLLNESVAIERDGASIHLAGIEDAHYYRLEDFHRATEKIPDGAVAILLSHTPAAYRHAAHAGIDLMLSGHTHGGQICLPGGAPVLTGRTPRRIVRGTWRHHRMTGYTAAGSGTSVIDARLNCPPEVTLHTLRCARPGKDA